MLVSGELHVPAALTTEKELLVSSSQQQLMDHLKEEHDILYVHRL
jgi:hypothetical protein